MKKSMVLYKSVYGSAKQYAEWIADELSCPIMPIEQFDIKQVTSYHQIIICGSLYAGRYTFAPWCAEQSPALAATNLFFACIGSTKPNQLEVLKAAAKASIPAALLKNAKVFHYEGRYSYKNLKAGHKVVMWLLGLFSEHFRKMNLQDIDPVKKENLQEMLLLLK